MKAEDTVMDTNDKRYHSSTLEEMLYEQAEISFKAGIKEVVEWVSININTDSRRDEWQAKLKEWGI